jgi:hypothetical protein
VPKLTGSVVIGPCGEVLQKAGLWISASLRLPLLTPRV